jgi:hypothetical protein
MSEPKTSWSSNADKNARRKSAAEAHGFGVVSPAERTPPPTADQSARQKSAAEAEAKAALLTPLAQIEKRTLATGAGQLCKKCKKPLPCDIVRVEKGQVLKVEGIPFVVGVRADFEMCCRCGNFFFTQQRT